MQWRTQEQHISTTFLYMYLNTCKDGHILGKICIYSPPTVTIILHKDEKNV